MNGGIDPTKAQAHARRLVRARIEATAIHLVNAIRQNISIPSRTVTYKQNRRGDFKKVLGARGSSRSRPGEFPHKDTGALRASITYQVVDDGQQIMAKVGSPLAYSKFLEFGTRRMAARPFIRRTLKEEREAIRQITEHGERSVISVGA